MSDKTLSQQDKSRSIQSLMDGRARRCSVTSTAGASIATQSTAHSYVSSMGQVAAAAVVEYYSNSSHDAGTYNSTTSPLHQQATATGAQQPVGSSFTNYRDDRSIASSVSTANSAVYSYSSETNQRQYNSVQGVASLNGEPAGAAYKQYHGRSLSLQEWNDTDRFFAASQSTVCKPAGVSRLMEQSRPACDHYERNCTLISPCCGLAFGCRFCHDECPVLPPPVAKRRSSLVMGACPTHSSTVGRRRSMPVDLQTDPEGDETHHRIDRHAVREVICRRCYTRQSSKT